MMEEPEFHEFMRGLDGFDPGMPRNEMMRLLRKTLAGQHPDWNGGQEGPLFQSCLESMKWLRQAAEESRGSKAATLLSVTLKQLMTMETIVVGAAREACRRCHGSGIDPVPDECPACSGTGRVWREYGGRGMFVSCRNCRGTGEIPMPCALCDGVRPPDASRVILYAGTRTGDILTSDTGTLHIVETVLPGGVDISGDDVHLCMRIPYGTFVRGGVVTFDAPDGEVGRLMLPRATPDGTTMRLKRRGLPLYGARGRGDLIVHLLVHIPGAEDLERLEPFHAPKEALDVIASG